MEIFIILFILFAVFLIYKIIIYIYEKKNYYPNLTLKINITNKKKMNDDDFIDFYLINNSIENINNHIKKIEEWKKEKIEKFNGNSVKIEKFNNRCKKNDFKAFKFVGIRTLTRYRQVNYERFPYKVETISNEIDWNEKEVKDRISFLEQHNYNITYTNYNRVDQRKALTKELKEIIKRRDNYTCQNCGKYMPDEVGLHIDHIIPIAKGGKSIESNLRVLCSKCNGKKGIKIDNNEKQSTNVKITNTIGLVDDNETINNIEQNFYKSYDLFKLEDMEYFAKQIINFNPLTDNDYLSLHYTISNIANILYSLDDKKESFNYLCRELCQKDISNYDRLFLLLPNNQTVIMTLTRMCIIYEREDNFEEAIKLCDIGIKYNFLDTNNKSFEIRKQRLLKKMNKKTKILN